MKAELLAPVGGKPHLIAAVNNGADAVYMGGMAFNARIFAENFSDEELPDAIKYAHAHGVKVYMTLNTLVKDEELGRALDYCNYIYGLGVDALIVQDLGLIRLLRKYLPDMPLHLSTQGTLYNKEALSAAAKLGISRVVPARELSIDEIREISSAASEMDPPIDVEVFVHGALCMCYSGQCHMSRVLGAGASEDGNAAGSGRTGNRGTCAQPCRQGYMDDSGHTYYALSPKDLCQINNIPELTSAGAASFKIEGRIKSPEYVATVTRIYRKYIDLYDKLEREQGAEKAAELYSVDEQDIQDLRQIFNRGDFTEGYLHGNPGADILSGASPKNQGIYLGKVVAVIDSENKVTERDEKSAVRGALRRGKVLACIEISKSAAESGIGLSSGDGLEFVTDDKDYLGDNPAGGVTTYIKDIGEGYYIVGDYDKGMLPGDLVFKVTDSKLNESALDVPEKRLPVTMQFTAREGQFPVLIMNDIGINHSVEITADHKIERAQKVATDKEMVEHSLAGLGSSVFTPGLTGIDVEMDDDIMVPLSVVKRMRREAVEDLVRFRTKAVISSRPPKLENDSIARIKDEEGLGSVTLDKSIYPLKINGKLPKILPIEEFMSHEEERSDKLPYILNVSKGNLDRYIRENFDAIAEACKETGILIGNLGWMEQFVNAGVKVYADYGLNVYNNQAKLTAEELGATLYMPSHETGVSDDRGVPIMITEHPVDTKTLTDRKGEAHIVEIVGDKTLIY